MYIQQNIYFYLYEKNLVVYSDLEVVIPALSLCDLMFRYMLSCLQLRKVAGTKNSLHLDSNLGRV